MLQNGKTTEKRRVTIQVEDSNIIEFFIDDAVLRALRKHIASSPDHDTSDAAGRIVNRALVHYLFEEMFRSALD